MYVVYARNWTLETCSKLSTDSIQEVTLFDLIETYRCLTFRNSSLVFPVYSGMHAVYNGWAYRLSPDLEGIPSRCSVLTQHLYFRTRKEISSVEGHVFSSYQLQLLHYHPCNYLFSQVISYSCYTTIHIVIRFLKLSATAQAPAPSFLIDLETNATIQTDLETISSNPDKFADHFQQSRYI